MNQPPPFVPPPPKPSWWTRDKIILFSVGGGLLLVAVVILIVALSSGSRRASIDEVHDRSWMVKIQTKQGSGREDRYYYSRTMPEIAPDVSRVFVTDIHTGERRVILVDPGETVFKYPPIR